MVLLYSNGGINYYETCWNIGIVVVLGIFMLLKMAMVMTLQIS